MKAFTFDAVQVLSDTLLPQVFYYETKCVIGGCMLINRKLNLSLR